MADFHLLFEYPPTPEEIKNRKALEKAFNEWETKRIKDKEAQDKAETDREVKALAETEMMKRRAEGLWTSKKD